jgi:peptide/nickel transport system permease protein
MLVFSLFWIVPGDAALVILIGDQGDEDSFQMADYEKLREELGLDRPIHIQYADWLWAVLRGDLGISLWYKIPVIDELKTRFPVSVELAVISIVMSFVLAVPLGVISAVKQDTGIDYASRVFALLGVALPTFWIGILMVFGLAFVFNWLPPLGYATLWEDPFTNLTQLMLPAVALAFNELAFTARITRSAMLEVLREDYVRTARAKGLRETLVVGRHALKNALLPVITITGYQFGRLLGGVIIIETIFGVPGIGSLVVDAIIHRDFVMMQAIILLTAAVVLLLNLFIDLFYGFLDPRIRYE